MFGRFDVSIGGYLASLLEKVLLSYWTAIRGVIGEVWCSTVFSEFMHLHLIVRFSYYLHLHLQLLKSVLTQCGAVWCGAI